MSNGASEGTKGDAHLEFELEVVQLDLLERLRKVRRVERERDGILHASRHGHLIAPPQPAQDHGQTGGKVKREETHVASSSAAASVGGSGTRGVLRCGGEAAGVSAGVAAAVSARGKEAIRVRHAKQNTIKDARLASDEPQRLFHLLKRSGLVAESPVDARWRAAANGPRVAIPRCSMTTMAVLICQILLYE